MKPSRNHIPVGRQNAISRQDLARLWQVSDRKMRDIVADMRSKPDIDGTAILSTSHSPSGYWRSRDLEEIKAFIHETEARAKSTFVALRGAREIVKRICETHQTSFL